MNFTSLFSFCWIARFLELEKFEELGSEGFRNSFCRPKISPRRLLPAGLLSSTLTMGLTRATGLCAFETLRISAASSRLIPPLLLPPSLEDKKMQKMWKSILSPASLLRNLHSSAFYMLEYKRTLCYATSLRAFHCWHTIPLRLRKNPSHWHGRKDENLELFHDLLVAHFSVPLIHFAAWHFSSEFSFS